MKISVRSIPKTFRRAGLAFASIAKEIEVDEKKLAILKAEPMLIVGEVSEKKKSEK